LFCNSFLEKNRRLF